MDGQDGVIRNYSIGLSNFPLSDDLDDSEV